MFQKAKNIAKSHSNNDDGRQSLEVTPFAAIIAGNFVDYRWYFWYPLNNLEL